MPNLKISDAFGYHPLKHCLRSEREVKKVQNLSKVGGYVPGFGTGVGVARIVWAANKIFRNHGNGATVFAIKMGSTIPGARKFLWAEMARGALECIPIVGGLSLLPIDIIISIIRAKNPDHSNARAAFL